jgi:short-subunit dehydrogenase
MNILITGGSSGLGKSIVEKLSRDKENNVFFTYNLSEESANTICLNNSNVQKIKCDFTNNEELNSLIEKIEKIKINVLINNYYSWPKDPLLPGFFLNKNFHKIDINLFIEEFKKNIIPTILISQEAIKFFRSMNKGKIVTVLSSIIDSPTVGSSIYLSNKNYLKGLCKVWSVENQKFNITSHYISPSFMLTGHTSKMDQRLVDQIINSTDSKQLMSVEHVSNKIYDFLIRDDLNDRCDIPL